MIGAIKFCHENHVIHRDVKLDNFVYESDAADAELKLIDFGLSHVLRYDDEKMRDRVGTLTYMAPEVLIGGSTGYTSACDMWSLGVVAYMLLSGRRPFHHPDREEKKRRAPAAPALRCPPAPSARALCGQAGARGSCVV